MKKITTFVCLLVTIAAVTFGQNLAYSHDFTSIQKHINENVETLDPIEGVYEVTLKRKIQPLSRNAQSFVYTYRCAIVKTRDNIFEIVDESPISSIRSTQTIITHLEENEVYNVRLKYTSLDNQIINSNIQLDGFLNFHFIANIHYTRTFGVHLSSYDYLDQYYFVKKSPLFLSAWRAQVFQIGENKYQGEIVHGTPSGRGRMTYKNGDIYVGEFVEGKRQGHGIYAFADGERYNGEWFQDQQHGLGIFSFKNGNTYEGSWSHDYQHGNGIMHYSNGDLFDGEWKHDMREGVGTYTYANGNCYRGEWKKDKKNGHGSLNYTNGDAYEGSFLDDFKDGKGIFYDHNGNVYEGDFHIDLFHGEGIYTTANGDRYIGHFEYGKPHGNGVLIKVNGEVIHGPFTNDDLEGILSNDTITQTIEWTGSGFAISNGYIVTNNHVIDEAKHISVKGILGDMNTSYLAEVVATDKVNDIALLKIKDSPSKGFGIIPYSISSRMADVGEDVFVLGYPLTQALGNEIKLTNGIISSRTGYQGDVANYQISAPVQPGNSGGPMFDSKGNVIGIVVAGVPGAENVGYAIKIAYLKLLIESAGLSIKFPANNTISTLSLSEKVKRVKNHVFYIECSR